MLRTGLIPLLGAAAAVLTACRSPEIEGLPPAPPPPATEPAPEQPPSVPAASPARIQARSLTDAARRLGRRLAPSLRGRRVWVAPLRPEPVPAELEDWWARLVSFGRRLRRRAARLAAKGAPDPIAAALAEGPLAWEGRRWETLGDILAALGREYRDLHAREAVRRLRRARRLLVAALRVGGVQAEGPEETNEALVLLACSDGPPALSPPLAQHLARAGYAAVVLGSLSPTRLRAGVWNPARGGPGARGEAAFPAALGRRPPVITQGEPRP